MNKLHIIKYLKNLWKDKYVKSNYYIFNYISNLYYRFMNKFDITFIKKNINNLKKIGFTFYNNNNNNEQPINKIIFRKELEYILKFKNGTLLIRNKIMKKICNCDIFTKPKENIINSAADYRYIINHHNTIKILDRILYYEILQKCNNNLPNPNIFIISFNTIKNNNLNNYNNTLSVIADKNTLSMKNVLLLDLERAYDSLNWNVIENLLYYNLKRKMNILYANEFTQQYMTILTNRIIKYKNTPIKVFKGVPTGLPTSTLIFTFIIEEIIIRWMNDNNFINNKDFIINIYIDDIYIKFLNISKIDKIISSLIIYLTRYNFNINFNKSKIDKKLYNFSNITQQFKILNEKDLYLGIPFTRNYKLYNKIILENLYKKHKLNYNWKHIYNIIIDTNHKYYKKIFGFMNYKLKPLLNNNNNIYDLIKIFISF